MTRSFSTAVGFLAMAAALGGVAASAALGQGSLFSGLAPTVAGSAPTSIVVLDYDRDGLPDMAVLNGDTGTVSLLRNTGGAFQAPSVVSVRNFTGSSKPRVIFAADMVGDTGPDLLVADQFNVVGVFRNNAGSFSRSAECLVAEKAVAVAGGELAAPGKRAIVAASADSTQVKSRVGDGEGGYCGVDLQATTAGLPTAVVLGQFNPLADTRRDFALISPGAGAVDVFLHVRDQEREVNGGTPGGVEATLGQRIIVGQNPRALAAADFNGDGADDLAVACAADTSVRIYFATGLGTFTAGPVLAVPRGQGPAEQAPAAIAAGDVTADGQPDIVVVSNAAAGAAFGSLPSLIGAPSVFGGTVVDVSGNQVAVGTSEGKGYRWTAAGGRVQLQPLAGDTASEALAISADGSTVVGSSTGPGGTRAVKWGAGGATAELVPLPPGGGHPSKATCATADGSVVVGEFTGGGARRAFMTRPGQATLDLTAAVGGIVTAASIKDDGSLLLGFDAFFNPVAVRLPLLQAFNPNDNGAGFTFQFMARGAAGEVFGGSNGFGRPAIGFTVQEPPSVPQVQFPNESWSVVGIAAEGQTLVGRYQVSGFFGNGQSVSFASSVPSSGLGEVRALRGGVGVGTFSSNGQLGYFVSGGSAQPMISGGTAAAFAVSRSGRYAAGRSQFGASTQATRWDGTAPLGLGSLHASPRPEDVAGAVADNGSVAGTARVLVQSSFVERAFRWTQAGGMQSLPLLAGMDRGGARGISADGSVVVGFSAPSFNFGRATRWTQATGTVALAQLAGTTTGDAFAVSADGTIVVGECGQRPVRWTNGVVAALALPAGFTAGGAATAVSADGAIVAGWARDASFVRRAVRWTGSGAGVAELLPLPAGASFGVASGVSNDGGVVVGDTGSGFGAWIWTAATGARPVGDVLRGLGLDVAGWRFDSAQVSGDGRRIAGFALNPQGQQEAYFADLRPQGGSAAVFRTFREGRFALLETLGTGLVPSSVAVGDVAGEPIPDGTLDVVVSNQGDGTVSVFRSLATSCPSVVSAPTWKARPEVGPTHPPGASGRLNAAMAYDAARGRLVLFGGSTGGGFLADTWEFDGSSWTRETPAASPPARSGHAMVFDSRRGRTVLFGGFVPGVGRVNDTWEWDGTNWVQRTGVGTPPQGRALHTAAFDEARGAMVVFGGQGASTPVLGDTWEFDGAAWTQRVTPAFPASPKPRYWANAAYDAARQRVVLFGGLDGGANLADTWTWDGAAWTQLPNPPAGQGPAARRAAMMAWDPGTESVVLFGGFNGAFFGDTWSLTDAWRLIAPAGVGAAGGAGPSPRQAGALAGHGATRALVLFGGQVGFGASDLDDDTWALAGGPVLAEPEATAGSDVVMRATVAGGTGGAVTSVKWWRNGSPLMDEPGAVEGSSSAVLRLLGVDAQDAGVYDVRVMGTAGCANLPSHGVALAVVNPCVADVVSIGGFPPADGELTVDDYTSFINAFAGDDLLADVVSIGGFPPADGELTVDDYTSFVNSFAEGCG